jgi:hypothetical protein
MAMTPSYALAHVFLPNLVKLKGGATVVSAIERNEKVFLDQVWTQAHVTHNPLIKAVQRDPYRIGVVTLPPPTEIGEAFMVGIVVNKSDPSFMRYFTLEHDYVLSKKANRTLLCERIGQQHTKHGDGPVPSGTPEADIASFIDAFMELVHPTKTVKSDRSYNR